MLASAKRASHGQRKEGWTVMHASVIAKLAAIASLLAVFAGVPVSAFEVRPDKNLTGGSVRTESRDAACGHARESRVRCVRRAEMKF